MIINYSYNNHHIRVCHCITTVVMFVRLSLTIKGYLLTYYEYCRYLHQAGYVTVGVGV